jgi:hypothetical protein
MWCDPANCVGLSHTRSKGRRPRVKSRTLTMSAVDKLTSELAMKAHIDAVNRDYVVDPHLGGWAWHLQQRGDRGLAVGACAQPGTWGAVRARHVGPRRGTVPCPSARQPLDAGSQRPGAAQAGCRCLGHGEASSMGSLLRAAQPPPRKRGLAFNPRPWALVPPHAEYRTVAGVAGPLVVVEMVKVGSGRVHRVGSGRGMDTMRTGPHARGCERRSPSTPR